MPFLQNNPSIAEALNEHNYAEPTAVQAAVMAADPADADLLVSAQTGSGKTVAFGLAIASTLLGENPRFEQAATPLALIVAPTRELALQVHRELNWLFAKTGARVLSCVGGMDPRAERRELARGAHIVVGTPGRLRDHMERGSLDTSALRIVVLDEADEMLDLGFREDLEFLLDAMPAERRTLLFSATIPRDIAALARELYDALGLQRARVRLVGVRVEQLSEASSTPVQVALDEPEHGWREADRAVDRASARFGAGSVRPASLLGDRGRAGRRPTAGRGRDLD